MNTNQSQETATVAVENVGGITETSVTLPAGVTVLAGRNATNRTSFLHAIMAALGSDDASLKGDADKGQVELAIGDETYTRQFTRQNGQVTTGGDPYLDDPTVADLFAFLLESNDARQAVARRDDLRDLIMRPVDTDEIEREIERLTSERERLQDELDELDSLKSDLPGLEEERRQLTDDIEEKRTELERVEDELEAQDADVETQRAEKQELEERLADLREKRDTLEEIRYDIETEKESREELRAEKRELEDELDDLPESPAADQQELEETIERLRSRKQSLEADVDELQSIVSFNEDQLDAATDGGFTALDDSGSVTDRLVADREVECWTCGSTVETDQIEATVERLRESMQEKLADVREIEDELADVKAKKREGEREQQRRESLERELEETDDELERTADAIEQLTDRREDVTAEIEALEDEVEARDDETYSEVLDLHKEANQLEYDIGRTENELERVEEEIADIEDRLADEDDIEERLAAVREDLKHERTKIERLERDAVDAFNAHMDDVLARLGYENLDRIWLERTEQSVREGRRKTTKSAFDLHVIRSTSSGATYEDTIDHLSESERNVTGLVFALAGYLVHDVHETVPFMLLDSLEAIDSNRIAALVEYFEEFVPHLVVALLPEDAQALDDEYRRVTDL
ncbi:archaea-specific SMC-related protein [Salarchaeum sp. III]|uniref:archaea-specific SMC-related protein n=1 Tax=Salarchaeum sp. III TaxID=3107927 RepID=UPI002EDB9AF5